MKELYRKPCVLIIVENLPVPTDRRVWQESIALRDAGYDVVVICPQMRGQHAAAEVLDGITIYRHRIGDEAVSRTGFLREYASALWGEIRLAWKAWYRHRFDVIHLCNPPDLLFLVAWPFKLLGAKIVYDVHDLCPEMYEAKFAGRGPLYWFVRLAERLTYACADVVLVTNESVGDIAVRRGRKAPTQIFVVRTAPHVRSEAYLPNEHLKKGRRFLVGYVGVMGSADGVSYLIDAADHIVNRVGRRDIQFLLMGAGPEYENLVRRRDRHTLAEFVDLPGWANSEVLFPALQTIDLGVSCDPKNSYNDCCTMNKVLEYMAFDKAQVMFDLKEGRASAGDGAVYVAENSAVKLAEAILLVLDDPAARERMGRCGGERIRTELSWTHSVRQLLKAYSVAMDGSAGTAVPSGKDHVFRHPMHDRTGQAAETAASPR